jgi:hypothetical protein
MEVEPLARLHADGRLAFEGPGFPPPGPARLVLWRPGERPAFALHDVRIGPGFRASPGAEGWIVLWVPIGTDGGVHDARRADLPP